MLEVYSHGVGSSCKGNEFHHEILHYVTRGRTLCGVDVTGRSWFRTSVQRLCEHPPRKFRSMDSGSCQRCVRAEQRLHS